MSLQEDCRHHDAEPIVEVALAIVRQDDRYLVDRRSTSDAFDGLWEFPGGKIQEGESPSQAARRECLEELGLHVTPHTALAPVKHVYEARTFRLHPVICCVQSGTAKARESVVEEVRWVTIDVLRGLPMPGANQKVLRLLSDHFGDS